MRSSTALPLSRSQAVDLYFMEHRAKLLDIAAFLDRVDRAGLGDNAATDASVTDDFRMIAFRQALALLSDGKPHRARRILELLSDPTTTPIPKAPMKGALGAYKPA